MKLNGKILFVLFLMCLGHFLVDLMIGIWPLFKMTAGLDIAFAAIVTGICVLFGEGLQGYFGSLADRGYSVFLLALGPLVAATSAFMPYGTTVPFFVFCLFITCLGSSAFHPTAAGIVSSLNPTRSGLFMAIFHASGLIGLSVSQWLYSLTSLGTTEPKTAYLALPAFLVAVALLALRKQIDIKREVSPQSKEGVLSVFRGFFKNPALRCLYFTLLGNQIVIWSIIFLLPNFVVTRASEPWLIYGGGHLSYVLGAACTAVPLGLLADKIRPEKVIFVATAFAMGLLYTLLLIESHSPLNLALLLFGVGGLLGAIQPLSISLGNRLVPEQRGMVSAFLMGFVWIFSEGLGITTSGILASLFTEDAPCRALLCMATFGVMSMILAYKLMQMQENSVQEGSVTLIG